MNIIYIVDGANINNVDDNFEYVDYTGNVDLGDVADFHIVAQFFIILLTKVNKSANSNLVVAYHFVQLSCFSTF